MTPYIYASLILLPLGILLLLVQFLSRQRKLGPLQEELVQLQERLRQLEPEAARNPELVAKLEQQGAELASIKTRLELKQEQLEELHRSEERQKLQFKELAGQIVEERGRVLQQEGEKQLGHMLKPFSQQLEQFRARVDEVHRDQTVRTATLLEQVRQLQESSNRVSTEANQLAQAIKGDSKTQGDWGELVIERILESSGLEKGREYEDQVSLRDENGDLKRPDFLVNLPDGKVVVLDSKVSLTAYERYMAAESDTEREACLKEHLQSVRRHIEELKNKQYEDLLGSRSLDFVVMCIPLEPAYQLAMRDERLIYDLAKTNVVLAGPANLLISLKLIAQQWRKEKENRNAQVIAEKAGRLYDQIILVYDAVAKGQQQMATAQKSVSQAMDRLKDGRGNAVNRIEDLRKLGAKVKKELPRELQERGADEDVS